MEDTRDILDELEAMVGYFERSWFKGDTLELMRKSRDEIRRLRADRDKARPEPSELPLEQMVADARKAIGIATRGYNLCGWQGEELGEHVLSLAEENERLRAELAEAKAQIAEHEAAERDLAETMASLQPTDADLKAIRARLSSLAKDDGGVDG
jgi:chromosome segregation ATPase